MAENVIYDSTHNIIDIIDELDSKIDNYTIPDNTVSINKLTSELRSTINSIPAMVGSPLVASTAAGMTDTTKVYVYTGSETGYKSGYWYYYDNGDWLEGGAYNSAALETDKTLSVADMAADAEVTGNEISDLKSALQIVSEKGILIGDLIEDEYVKTDGDIAPYTNWDRTDYIDISMANGLYITKGRGGAYNCFFDSNKEFVSSFTLSAGTTLVYVPADAKYVMISDLDLYMATLKIKYTNFLDDMLKHTYPMPNIANNTDYNTLLTSGSYAVRQNASAASMTNCPIPNSHRLDILQLTQSNKLIQIITPSNNNGQIWYRLYDSETFSAWRGIGSSGGTSDNSGVPSYYESHVVAKENLIRQNISDVGFSGDSFAIVADTHWGRNTKNSPSLIEHIARYTPVDKLMLMGDYYITQSTKMLAYNAMQTSIGAFRDKGMELCIIPGNHDYNKGTVDGYPILSEAEVYGQIMTGQDSVTKSSNTCTFYFDNEPLKIRYYFTTCMYDSSYNIDSYKWIFANMENIPSGYKVIIFTHTGLSGSGARNHNYAQYLTGALKALRDKTSYTFDGVTFNYQSTNAIPIAIFSGHHHVDYVFSDNEIACIQTTTDAYYYEDSSNYDDSEIPTLTRTLGTVSEQAFDVATVDANNSVVYLTRVGGGNNRIVHCGKTAVSTSVTLTSQLSGTLTWKSSDTSVATVSNGVVTKVATGVCMVSATNDSTDETLSTEFWNIVC